MKKDQNGFGTIESLLALVLVAVVAFGGYYVWNTQQDKSAVSKISQSTPQVQSSDGPAPGHTVATSIKLVTGQYIPARVDVKKGETVTWEISDDGPIPQYAIVSNADSSETFSSNDLKTGDKFSHTFDKVGTFGWHDKYNGNLTGSVTVSE